MGVRSVWHRYIKISNTFIESVPRDEDELRMLWQERKLNFFDEVNS